MKIAEVMVKRSASLGRVLAVIERLKDDEIITTSELLGTANVAKDCFYDHRKELTPYRVIYKTRAYYGNKVAVAALRRQIGLK